MGWCTTSDLDRFVEVAASYLKPRAAENTLVLSAAQAAWRARAARVLAAQAAQATGDAGEAGDAGRRPGAGPPGSTVSAEGGMLFGWWEPPNGSGPRGAFVHDPSAPLLIAGRAPELAAALAATLAKAGRPVCGVDAPVEAADAFAAAWSQRSGMAVQVHKQTRVYRMTCDDGGGADQGGQAGRLRLAAPADRALLVEWLAAFAAESGERIGSAETLADDLIGYAGAAFWEAPQRPSRIKDAAHYLASPHHRDTAHRPEQAYSPVALATVTRPLAGTVRISLVYTQPERRHHGYAAALTLALSRSVLAGGDQVVVITDRNRPDRGVARLGYQLVGERIVLRFGPPTGPLPRLRTGPMPRFPTGPLPRIRRNG